MWSDFFKAGGWGMYPTSLFGFLLIAAAVVLALRPERRFAWLVVALGAVTQGSGMLGTSMGVITTFHYLGQVPEPKRLLIAAYGCAESLHNLVLSLILVVLASLIAAIAAARAAWGKPHGSATREA